MVQKFLTAFETPGPSFISTSSPQSVTAERINNDKCKTFGNTVPTTIGRA